MSLYGVTHGHSMYSIKDSALSVKDYIATVKELGGVGACLTDHGVLTGIPDFLKEAKKQGIKGIPGCELYVVREGDEHRHHLIVIAKDYIGYQALMRAATEAQKNLVNGFPCLREELIPGLFGPGSKGHGHVFCTSACVQGVVCGILARNDMYNEDLKKIAHKMSKYKNPNDPEYLKQSSMLADIEGKISELTETLKELKPIAERKYVAVEKRITSREAKGEDVSEDRAKLEADKKESADAAAKIEKCKTERASLQMKRKELSAYCSDHEKTHDRYLAGLASVEAIQANMKPEDELVEEAVEKAQWYAGIFGRNNFFLEFQYHGFEWENTAYPLLEKVMERTHFFPIAANDSHYAKKSDVRGRWIVQSLRFNKAMEVRADDDQYYVKTDEELLEALKNVISEETAQRAIKNIKFVIDHCDVQLPETMHFPRFDTGSGETSDEYLRRMAEQGILRRYPGYEGWTEKHQNRMDYELRIISELGYSDYLCIVEDFLREGREYGTDNAENVGMGVGPGRGSAVGSLVCYLVGITDIDPIRFNLLFERFLNKDRVSYPDIDSDFGPNVRGKVIEYVKKRYGEEGVCGIITYGTLAARNAIRSSARILADEKGEDPKEWAKVADLLCSAIPQTPSITLDDCKDRLDIIAAENSRAASILSDARLIEGTIVQYGMHAAGVIISDQGDVGEYVPLAYNVDQEQWMAQYAGPDCEKMAKLLKMDFLGLKNLDIITDALKYIYHNHGIRLNMTDIGRSLTDGRTTAYDARQGSCIDTIFAKGLTNGVFQFESSGMKQLLTRFKPTTISDIALLNALYRPGPMQYIDQIIETRKSNKMPDQILPVLNETLADTYGYPVYQESVMRICHEVAGMTLGEADRVRWAMAKKHADVLEEYHAPFVNGLVNAGAKQEDAEEYWTQLQSFASYAFNKSHAVAYAFVAFYTAWLKWNYPLEFYTSLLNHSDNSKYEAILSEAIDAGIHILPPDINQSDVNFTCDGTSIRFGLSSINGIKGAADQLIEDRGSVPFESFEDLLKRTRLTDSAIESMIYAGCCDSFYKCRETMAHVVSNARKAYKKYTEMEKDGEELLQQIEMTAPDTPEFKRLVKKSESQSEKIQELRRSFRDSLSLYSVEPDPDEKLAAYEKEYLGIGLSWNPLDEYGNLDKFCDCHIADVSEGRHTLCGLVSDVRIQAQKSDGKTMAFCTIADRTGKIDCVVFGKNYPMCEHAFVDGKVITINGTVRPANRGNNDEEKLQMTAYSAKVLPATKPVIVMRVKDLGMLAQYRYLFDTYAGQHYQVRVFDEMTQMYRDFKEPVFVNGDILNLRIDGVTFTRER